MSNPFTRRLSKKLAKNLSKKINEEIEKSDNRDKIKYSICIITGLLFITSLIFRLINLPFNNKNNIQNIILFIFGSFILLVGLSFRKIKKKDIYEKNYREK